MRRLYLKSREVFRLEMDVSIYAHLLGKVAIFLLSPVFTAHTTQHVWHKGAARVGFF